MNRTPLCPLCSDPLTPLGVYFVTGPAFCNLCGPRDPWLSLKVAQLLNCPGFAPHASTAHGLTFYTPATYGTPNAAELAHELGIGYVLANLPIGFGLHKIPQVRQQPRPPTPTPQPQPPAPPHPERN